MWKMFPSAIFEIFLTQEAKRQASHYELLSVPVSAGCICKWIWCSSWKLYIFFNWCALPYKGPLQNHFLPPLCVLLGCFFSLLNGDVLKTLQTKSTLCCCCIEGFPEALLWMSHYNSGPLESIGGWKSTVFWRRVLNLFSLSIASWVLNKKIYSHSLIIDWFQLLFSTITAENHLIWVHAV